MTGGVPPWLDWSRRLAALAQAGLHYTENVYDRERFAAIRAIASEMMAAGFGLDPRTAHDILARGGGYETPKVDVRGVVFRGDTILMVREAGDGLWALPGGFADVGETPSEAVEKEIREESGIEARAVRLLAALDRDRPGEAPTYAFHIYKLFFLCEERGGALSPSVETLEAAFVPIDNPPPLSLGRTLPRHVAMAVRLRDRPDLGPVFD